jgi:VanZ family protein
MKRFLMPQPFFVVLLTAAITSFLLFNNFGDSDSRIIDAILSFGHLLLFGAISLVTIWVFNKGKWQIRQEYLYTGVWIVTTSIGALTECIQAFIPYRHFRVGDILTDSLGSVIFLTFYHSFQKDTIHKNIVLMRIIAFTLMIMLAYPIFAAALDTWEMERNFPLLSSFETYFEMSRWMNIQSELVRSKLHPTDGKYSLKVFFHPGEYPGMSMNYLQHDWRGYKRLAFDVILEGSSPLKITVRVNDKKHNNEYTDRFNKSFELLPGLNHISIDIMNIMRSPKGRTMDLTEITNICVFTYKIKETRTTYFDNFRLER